jgi:hypothetical protein
MHSDRDEGYSSFSGTESEGGERQAQGHQAQQQAFWLPHMGSAVDTQDWGAPAQLPGPQPGAFLLRNPLASPCCLTPG